MIASGAKSFDFVRFADVILPLNLSGMLTYGIPDVLQGKLSVGMRVEVALGRNRQYAGIVARLHNDRPESYTVKPIRNKLDEQPVVTETQLRFWNWIGAYYLATPGEVMQAALPAYLKLSNETALVWHGGEIPYQKLSDDACIAAEALEQRKQLSVTELRNVVPQGSIEKVVRELLDQQIVSIKDNLEEAYRKKKERVLLLAPQYDEESLLKELFKTLEKAPRQLDVLLAYIELAHKEGLVRQTALLERAGASAAQVRALLDKGVFLSEEREVDRLIFEGIQKAADIVFTPAQQQAFHEVEKQLREKEVTLLEGVTGSGKTLIYIEKIRQCIAEGKQALLLLPEIALTTQLVRRLYAYFGEELGVYHSRFSNNERIEIWEKVKDGRHKLIVGPRSALWLPFQQLGIVIADEEHDISYKQKDPAPRFHARDAAIYLAGLHGAPALLGSATPSIESLYNAKTGKYGYVWLQERYLGVRLAQIEVVNAKSVNTLRSQDIQLITPELLEEITQALRQRRQVILFQNRRGYAPFQLCLICGWVPHCKNCAVSMTYHKSSDKLQCHYCGMKAAVVHNCPACGSNKLQSKTFGTERIEEEIQKIFPDARVARMDVDSMRGKDSMALLMDKLEKGKVDILVGTQMVVKGLDIAGVSLVGVLSADSLLSFPDFRVNERSFQLMEQVSGRAGRADGAGKVIIQAYNLQHPVLNWVRKHDVRSFYNHEIQFRAQFGYPPFRRLIKIIFKHREEPKAKAAAAQMAGSLEEIEDIEVQGPAPALVSRVRNLYIYELLVKCPKDSQLLHKVKDMLHHQKSVITAARGMSGLHILFDVDPL